jgi:hypothetical protein
MMDDAADRSHHVAEDGAGSVDLAILALSSAICSLHSRMRARSKRKFAPTDC